MTEYLDAPCPDCGNATVPPYTYDPNKRKALLHTPPCGTCGRKARVTIYALKEPDAQGRTHVFVLKHNGKKRTGKKVLVQMDDDVFETWSNLSIGTKSSFVNMAVRKLIKEIGA